MAGITLLGPNPAQPFDLQTQQAQLAQAQQIAMSLIAQGLAPGAAVIHSGSASNPFSRDVPNIGGALGRIAQDYFGGQALENVQQQQLALAANYNAMTQADEAKVNNAYFGTPATPGGPAGDAGEMTPPMAAASPIGGQELVNTPLQGGTPAVAGNPAAAISAAGQSLNPQIRAAGDALRLEQAKALAAVMVKQVPTPADALGALKDYPPSQVAASFAGNTPGMAGMDVNQLNAPYPKVIDTSRTTGTVTTVPVGTGSAGNIAKPTSFSVAPPASPIVMPGQPYTLDDGTQITNNTGMPLQRNPVNHVWAPPPELADSPMVKEGMHFANELPLDFQTVTKEVNNIPRLVQIGNLAQRAITGGWASVRQDMEQIALQLGVTQDQLSSVSASQSLTALILPHVAGQLREVQGSRPTEKVVGMVMGAAGDTTGDPRHIVDMAGNSIAQIMSDAALLNEQTIPQAQQTWFGAQAGKYNVAFPPVTLPADSPINIQRQGNSYVNTGLTTPRPFGQAGGVTIKTVGDQAYKQIGVNPDGSGRWAVATPQVLDINQ